MLDQVCLYVGQATNLKERLLRCDRNRHKLWSFLEPPTKSGVWAAFTARVALWYVHQAGDLDCAESVIALHHKPCLSAVHPCRPGGWTYKGPTLSCSFANLAEICPATRGVYAFFMPEAEFEILQHWWDDFVLEGLLRLGRQAFVPVAQ